mgnify:CR=1 FL=1
MWCWSLPAGSASVVLVMNSITWGYLTRRPSRFAVDVDGIVGRLIFVLLMLESEFFDVFAYLIYAGFIVLLIATIFWLRT